MISFKTSYIYGMTQKALLVLLLITMSAAAYSQTMVTGHVVDEALGDDIIGASVTETDATGRIVSGTVTDFNGNFSLQVKSTKNQLSVSYIGYKPWRKAIGETREFIVKLKDESATIKEVVVKGRKRAPGESGFNISQRELSTASQTMNFSKIEGLSFTSADDALQGQISGLDIVGGGAPGSGSQMRIRGTSTITGNAQPLVVVNGVPFSGDTGNIDFGSATEEEYADLLNVNVDDIEEITVLKDAASTAMWGSNGANGVLLITTKKGSRGRTQLSYSYKLSGQTQPEGMDMLSGADYTMLMKQEFFNRKLGSNESYADYSFDELNYNYTGFAQAYNYDKNTDWVDAVTKKGWTHDHYLTLSGGGERANFRLSAGYYDRTGTNLKQEYQRYSSRVQLDYNVSQRIMVGAEVQFTYGDNDKNYSSLLDIAYKKMPNMSIYEHDAEGNNTGRYFNITPGQGIGNSSGKFDGNQRSLMNPVALGNLAKNNVKNYRILPKIQIRYDIFDPEKIYLRYQAWVSIDMNHERTEKYLPSDVVYDAVNNYSSANQATSQVSDKRTVATENSLTWQSRFKNPQVHNLQMQLKMQTSSSTTSSQLISSYGLPSSDITDAAATGRITNTQNANSTDHSVGWMGRLHYVLHGRYIFDANVRIDGSTQFGDNNRYGTFPGISGKWILSDEPLFRKWFGEKVFTLLAFRPSWGIAGRQPGKNYLQYSLLSADSYGYLGMSAVYPLRIRLDGLKWEKVTSMNWGFDLEMWDGKVAVNADIYHKRTNDLLFSNISIPSTSGFATLSYKNVGVLDNDGWEVNVAFNKIIERGKFSLDFNFNLASNRNEIIEMDPSVLNNYNNTETFGNGVYGTRLQVGNSLGSIYGYRYKGVYSYSIDNLDKAEAEGKTVAVARDANGNVMRTSDGEAKPMYYYYNTTKYQFQGGDAIYEDINHDGSIDQYDVVYLGNCNPKLNGGWGFTVRYDKLSLNLFCNFRWGNKIINMARMNAENMYGAYNQCSTVNWRWRKEGDVTNVPRAVYQQGYNWLGSDRYVEDGSFMRLKYVTVRYQLPTGFTKHLGVSRVNAYFTINNLFCWTKYSGADPEISTSGQTGQCIDNSTTPRSKDWTLGLSLTF
ncbi:MAG: SusC/RagA family TonB-linked outer membrane protein [Prevotella sp.]